MDISSIPVFPSILNLFAQVLVISKRIAQGVRREREKKWIVTENERRQTKKLQRKRYRHGGWTDEEEKLKNEREKMKEKETEKWF